MPAPTIFLFDIDGTLVSTGAGRRALTTAFARCTGRGDACDHFSFGGMTDRAIVREGLRSIGQPHSAAGVDAILDAYLEHLADELSRCPTYAVLPQVRETVTALRAIAGYAIGLGTGNLRRGAQLKLARGGIDALFDFGGYGCDDEDRVGLLAAGAQRGAERLGRPLAECRVIVIGDTPRDIAAAQGLGADCLAVATGGFTLEALRAAGATWSFADLGAPGALATLRGEV